MRKKKLDPGLWVCPECNKQIRSPYPAQLSNNKKYHLVTHKIKARRGKKHVTRD